VVDPRAKVDLWGFEGVIGGKVDGEEVDPARVGRIPGAHYRSSGGGLESRRTASAILY
jgi:hypothetical protein